MNGDQRVFDEVTRKVGRRNGRLGGEVRDVLEQEVRRWSEGGVSGGECGLEDGRKGKETLEDELLLVWREEVDGFCDVLRQQANKLAQGSEKRFAVDVL